MAEELYARIIKNPKYHALKSKRNSYAFLMTVLMFVAYYGYILLIAFNKEFLATKVAAGGVMSIGIPMGLGVILFTIVLTTIYVRRANSEFDTETEEIIKEARK